MDCIARATSPPFSRRQRAARRPRGRPRSRCCVGRRIGRLRPSVPLLGSHREERARTPRGRSALKRGHRAGEATPIAARHRPAAKSKDRGARLVAHDAPLAAFRPRPEIPGCETSWSFTVLHRRRCVVAQSGLAGRRPALRARCCATSAAAKHLLRARGAFQLCPALSCATAIGRRSRLSGLAPANAHPGQHQQRHDDDDGNDDRPHPASLDHRSVPKAAWASGSTERARRRGGPVASDLGGALKARMTPALPPGCYGAQSRLLLARRNAQQRDLLS